MTIAEINQIKEEKAALAEIFFKDFFEKLNTQQRIKACAILMQTFDPHNPVLATLKGESLTRITRTEIPTSAYNFRSLCEFAVIVTGPCTNKLSFVKHIQAWTGMGLKDCKDIVDQACTGGRGILSVYMPYDVAQTWVDDLNRELMGEEVASVGIIIT
jgi:ribosomal protein L7/L12